MGTPAVLSSALRDRDAAGAHAAIDQMTNAVQTFYARLQDAERAWNELAPAAAGD